MIIDALALGATGGLVGLFNALREESIQIFDHAAAGRASEGRASFDWLLPLVPFDMVSKFVKMIKLVQAHVGLGTTNMRSPRLDLEGDELEAAIRVLRERMA